MHDAQRAIGLGDQNAAFSFDRHDLFRAIDQKNGNRPRNPTRQDGRQFGERIGGFNDGARNVAGGNAWEYLNDMWVVSGRKAPTWCEGNPCTVGQYIFLNGQSLNGETLAHEYIHLLQWEGRGAAFGLDYALARLIVGESGPRHPDEAVAYLYEGMFHYFKYRYEVTPWLIWKRPPP